MARRSLLLVAVVGVLGALALGVTTASGDTAGAPVATQIPEALGTPGVGKTIHTTNGTWSTSATFNYQWLRCVKGYRGCADGPSTYTVIPGATAQTYVPVAADVGHILVARVTATNAAGSTTVMSSGLGLVEGKRPGVLHEPWIQGTKKVGQRLEETDARFTRSPYQFRDQWLRCSAGGNACRRITGKVKICYSDGTCLHLAVGTNPDYRPTAKDEGHRLRVRVAAWNGAGRSTATSAPTRIITR